MWAFLPFNTSAKTWDPELLPFETFIIRAKFGIDIALNTTQIEGYHPSYMHII